ncbi:MAG: TRAM domain-containing protein, partial [Candidatus Fournierella pullistercoris]|nr:TRAM domain-containing protein [Candidatus Fournierella pullistercoris]
MSIAKNTLLPLTIESLSSDGSGVARHEGKAIFIPGTAPGDKIQAKIVKDMGRYAFAIVDEMVQPSPAHIPADCSVYRPCGGCCFRHMDYDTEAQAKQQFVQDAFDRLGGFSQTVLPILS